MFRLHEHGLWATMQQDAEWHDRASAGEADPERRLRAPPARRGARTVLRSLVDADARDPHRGSTTPASAGSTRPPTPTTRSATQEYQRLVHDELLGAPARGARGASRTTLDARARRRRAARRLDGRDQRHPAGDRHAARRRPRTRRSRSTDDDPTCTGVRGLHVPLVAPRADRRGAQRRDEPPWSNGAGCC